MVITVVAALCSAAASALASVLQQRAARAAPPSEAMSLRLLGDLVRRPLWLAGIAAAAAGFGFQALALAYGTLVLAQPLIVLELFFALPVVARLGHGRLGVREWSATACVIVGLALFLSVASPSGAGREPSHQGWIFTVAGVGVVVGSCWLGARRLAGRRTRHPLRATLLGVGAGTLFGLLAAVLKSATSMVADHGYLGALTSWQPYTLGVVAILGELFAQSAFQAGPLPASLPVMDALEPGVAVAIAVGAFGEHVAHSPPALAAEAVGLIIIAVGIVTLDRSPLILALNASEHRSEEQFESSLSEPPPQPRSRLWPRGPGSAP